MNENIILFCEIYAIIICMREEKHNKGGLNMNIDYLAFDQVANTLAKQFDSMYYVDIETGNFIEFFHSEMLSCLSLPKQGSDFFSFLSEQAKRTVHPDDLDYVLSLIDKEKLLKKLSENTSSLIVFRFVLDGKIMHVCHFSILCDDKKHILGCIKNIESEFLDREEQENMLQSAERLARLDELTGIKNKNAFSEHVREIDEAINIGDIDPVFGVVMCDINDLKQINDTRGHSFGDEAIQKACRMICDIFEESSVYRIGGDEFVVILTGNDFTNRESLLATLKKESETNGRFRTGPVVACGMAKYNPGVDRNFHEVYNRADGRMYANKNELKSGNLMEEIRKRETSNQIIPEDRRRKLDRLYGALHTVAGDGYIFLTDLKYSFSRWSLSSINDFGLPTDYMYNVEDIWKDYIHPEDVEKYLEAINSVFEGTPVLYSITYRARKADGTYITLKPRGFILNDSKGIPEYFGGIMIPQ